MCGVAGADEEGEAHRPQPSGKVPEKSDCHAADKGPVWQKCRSSSLSLQNTSRSRKLGKLLTGL